MLRNDLIIISAPLPNTPDTMKATPSRTMPLPSASKRRSQAATPRTPSLRTTHARPPTGNSLNEYLTVNSMLTAVVTKMTSTMPSYLNSQ